tara:strand:- start:187 stop:471 length:285 start_codon:yes stop_codon:yes gene_type:complete
MKKLNLLALASASLLLFSSHSFGSHFMVYDTVAVPIDCAIRPTVLTYMTAVTDEERATTEAALLNFKQFCSRTGGMKSVAAPSTMLVIGVSGVN